MGVVSKQLVPKAVAVLADPDQFDSVWEEFMTSLEKANIEKAEEEYTQLIQQKVELWSN